jgi:uncharacterized protein
MKTKSILILLILGTTILFSLDIPPLKGRINDLANILSAGEEARLDKFLEEAENKTTSQFVLLTLSSLQEESLEDYSIRVAEKWKIGQKGLDNGVIVIIAMAEHKIRIEVGYGLESILTDAKCGYIIRNHIVESFRKGDYYGGIDKAFVTITGIVNKEFDITPEELARYKKAQRKDKGGKIPFGLFIFIILIIMSIFRGGKGSGRGGSIFWGGGSGGSSGGFGGGGFSGGGGSFGGGGASGGW